LSICILNWTNGAWKYNINESGYKLDRVDTNRIPEQVLNYKPRGRKNIGQPKKRWKDELHLEG